MVASIAAVSSAGAAASYYGQDNYYARDADQPEPTAWFGRGARELGLDGKVEIATFERVLKGDTLDGRWVGQRPNESVEQAAERTHRPGVDVTFSPPKDVSLLLYLGGDTRIMGIHRKAVDTALRWTERHLAAARIRKGSKAAEAVTTGKLVAAKFEHDISRDQDPQLHTHTVIANMTQTQDGRWRALHNEPLWRHAKLIGLVYDAEMRVGLRRAGYDVTLENGHTGQYRVEGVPDAAKDAFSQGAKRIRDAAETLDHDTPKTRKALAVKTRPTKQQISQDDRHAAWEERGREWTLALREAAAQAQQREQEGCVDDRLSGQLLYEPKAAPPEPTLLNRIRALTQRFFKPTRDHASPQDDPYLGPMTGSERAMAAAGAVSFAIRHLEEREAAFSLHHVRRVALEHGADGLQIAEIDKHLRMLRQHHQVRTRARDPEAESTTARSIAHERRTQTLVAQAGKTEPLVSEAAVQARLAQVRLTKGQQAAIATILSGTDRLVGVQGYAGTGKTTMMRQTSELAGDLAGPAQKGGYAILGLAPTHSARETLEHSAGFTSQTVAQFLIDAWKDQAPPDMERTIVLVDESSFLSTKSMNLILERVLAMNPARLVLSGDRRQHGAVEAGRPFDIAQRSGMTTAIMKDIVRLQARTDADTARITQQRDGVAAAAEGRVMLALKRLEANMHVPERTEDGRTEDGRADLAGAAVKAWRTIPDERRAGALVVVPGHRVRGLVNAKIREHLMEDGTLGGKTTTIDVLKRKDLTRVEAESARSYQPKDVLEFHGRLDAVNAKRGVLRTVVAVDEERGMITLRNDRGREYTLSLATLRGRFKDPPFALSRRDAMEVSVEDKVMFVRSEKSQGVSANDRAVVKAFDDRTVTLDLKGRERVFQRNDPALRSLTHAYALTSYAAQGKTAQDVVAVIDSKERVLTNQVGFYVSVSRTADTLAVIVDDKAQAASALAANTGVKSSALDTLGRLNSLTGLDEPPAASRAPQPGAEQDAAGVQQAEQAPGASASPQSSQGGGQSATEQSVGAEENRETPQIDQENTL